MSGVRIRIAIDLVTVIILGVCCGTHRIFPSHIDNILPIEAAYVSSFVFPDFELDIQHELHELGICTIHSLTGYG